MTLLGGGPLNESQVTLHKFLAIIWNSCFNTKVMFDSRAVSYFYETEFEFWLALGQMDSFQFMDFLFWVWFSLEANTKGKIVF